MSQIDIIRRRRLPHWDVEGAPFFLTSCLEGSIPAQGLLDIAGYRNSLETRPLPPGKTQAEWAVERWKLAFVRREHWLDVEPAVRHLADPILATIVVDAMFFFAGQRYDLLAFVVMPSHIHWVFQPLDSWVKAHDFTLRKPREQIVHGLNRHTGYACNIRLGRQGAFWQHESYDHWVRDAEELERIIHYIEGNPVKARLVQSPEDWLFSSARYRKEQGLELGEPLLKQAN